MFQQNNFYEKFDQTCGLSARYLSKMLEFKTSKNVDDMHIKVEKVLANSKTWFLNSLLPTL